MRITPAMTANNALYNLQKSRERLDNLQELISSGTTYNKPSDDPIATRQLLDLSNKIKQGEQYSSNISKGLLWLNVTETTMDGMASIVAQAKKVAGTITSGSTDSVVRSNTISQLTELKKQLVDLGNTQLGDQYIFGGLKNDRAPFGSKDYSVSLTSGTNPVAMAANQLADLTVGMTVSGTGIVSSPPTTITKIDASTNEITLSQAPNQTITSNLTFGNSASFTPSSKSVVSGLSFALGDTNINMGSTLNISNLSVGMTVSGTGIQSSPPTTIQAIDSATNTVTLSQAAIGAGSDLTFGDDALKIGIGHNSEIAVNVSGGQLLKGVPGSQYGNTDILGAFDDLITAINANDPTAIQKATATLETGALQITNARTDVASRAVRLDSADKMLSKDKSTLSGIIGNMQNIDYIKAATELSMQKTAFEAALSSTAKISQMSLLDYLN